MRESASSIPRHPSHPQHPRAPTQAPTHEPFAEAERHLHRIAVETGHEPVFVTIGQPLEGSAASTGDASAAVASPGGGSGHAPIPGGFAKFFNRVIDCGAWASLPDAARAVYLPMVRFADGRDGFRVRIGLAALMRYTQLSRSSVKRALRALLDSRLIAIVRAGGVAPDGTNRTNVYQLLLPEPEGVLVSAPPCSNGEPAALAVLPSRAQSAARAKRGGSRAPQATVAADATAPDAPASPVSVLRSPMAFSASSWADTALPLGSVPDPLPSPLWSPTPSTLEPPAGRQLVPADGPRPPGTRPAGEPLHRTHNNSLNTEGAAVEVAQLLDVLPELPEDAASQPRCREMIGLLQAWGVAPEVAADLARDHAPAEIRSAIALARQAKARRRLRNPAGYIVRCLEEAWAAGAVVDGRAVAPLDAGCAISSHAGRRAEEDLAVGARAAADARIDELDDQTLEHLAGRVLAMHADRPAMLRLLSARAPRASRLMRAEISALMEV